MTYIEPTPPGAPETDQPPQTSPEHDPSAVPDETPPIDPGGGGPGDSRPHDASGTRAEPPAQSGV